MNFEVDIDALVLHGFASHERHVLAAALERELARLLGEPGAANNLARDGKHAPLASEFERAPNAKPEALGAQVAQAVFASLQNK